MRRPGRPTLPLTLSNEERETLGAWARRPKTAQALAQRARMILGCADGKTNTAVAEELRVSKPTVGKWRSRFLERRVDGLLDFEPSCQGPVFSSLIRGNSFTAKKSVPTTRVKDD